ncbi:MAG TPA: ABC transporter permease [Longimicrobiaceae bacterium]|jgi:predicted permease|nr:ABC transporter permease [Longimicrobiaceae bacterium]
MKTLFARVRSFWHGLRRPDQLWAEMDEEMRFHVEMEADRLIRERGLDEAEARRQAAISFGGTEKYKEQGREARGLGWVSGLTLDLKLGGRMLVKHPALTVIATIAVAFAIAVGTVGFEIARQALWPTIPLPDGNAIVALRNWNVADNAAVPASRRDYELWRDGLSSITDLGAVEVEERSVAVSAGPGQPETVANVTASTFALTRVPALMGRALLEGDERGGAEEVVVVGYDFWKNKLGGAADAVGRVIHISGTPVTIVGVMPRGYGFPQRNEVWRPLHLERLPEASPSLRYVFGRLAPDRSREEATTQAAAIGARAATMFPETHKNVRLQVLSLSDAVSDLPESAVLVLASINVFLVLLAALLCGNVAMLLFARAVSRERELLVRTALGASRGRLVMQLFGEALLLCAVGAVVGLMVARFVLARTWTMIEEQSGPLPFWIDTSISTTTILYAVGLTLFAATIAGVVPALKVVSGSTGGRLRAASSGGGGLQFGGVWTVVIVAQIALTTVLPVPLLGVGGDFARKTPAGFPAEAFLTATLEIDRFDGAAASGDTVPAVRAARLEERYRSLAERLRQEPGVLDVTYADQMPVMRHAVYGINMDPGPAAKQSERCVGGYCVGNVSVDPRFFDVIGAPVIRGRALATADAEHQTRAVLVNEFFVDQVMGGRNPIGRRLRFFSSTRKPTAESWHEIVGIVPDLGVSDNQGDFGRARIFQAALPRQTGPLRVAIHVRGDPQAFAVRLRELADAIDPALRVIDPKRLPRLAESVSGFWIALLLGFTGVTLMLSLAGVYGVTAFSVAKRTREIGVRVALGAQPLQVLATVFKRPFVQIALGVGIGAVLGLGLANNDLSDVHLDDFGITAVFALSTILCCALACIVPTRRALRIQPTEALKDEG